MKTADAVVIGAGINGASTAFNLQKRGCKKVILLDKYLIASGGTGRSAAIVRQHYSNEELVKMVKRAVEIFHHFDDEVGGDAGFVNCGWAFMIPAEVAEGFAQNIAMQQRLGVVTKIISKEELKAMEPRIEIADVHRIAYEPGSGYADPHLATYSYVQRFRERGGELMPMTPAQALRLENGRVKGVKTAQGEIATGVVVNAAGPWAPEVGKMAGLDIPIKVTREEEFIVETRDLGGPPKLAISDAAKAFYYRPHGKTQMLVGRGFPKPYDYVDPDHYREQADASFIAECSTLLTQRFPSFSDAIYINAYTGLYDVTPDWHPILGAVEQVQGFYMCAGFSGHGFKTGPALGELMAEEILDGKAHTVDLARFKLSRFARGELFQAAYGANRA